VRASIRLRRKIRALGRRAIAMDCDVTRADQVADCIARAERELGPLTGLVNNAGVASEAAAAPIVEMTDELWFSTIDVNLNGVYRLSKAAARAMLAHGRPSAIVNVSSLAGRFGFPNYGAYCASKFGVIGLTQQMAAELAPRNIRVNCICPGSVDSDMLDGTIQRKASLAGVPFAEFKASYNSTLIPMGVAAARRAGCCRCIPAELRWQLRHRTDSECRWRLSDGLGSSTGDIPHHGVGLDREIDAAAISKLCAGLEREVRYHS